MTHEALVFVRRGDECLVVHRASEQGGSRHSVAGDVGAPFSYGHEDWEPSPRLVEAPADWEPALDWEHDDYRRCALDEALELLFWPEPRDVLRGIG